MQGNVVAVSSSPAHSMSKINRESIRLLEGIGVEGDVHSGSLVQHRSRRRGAATPPNLRQVHLVHGELFDELGQRGFVLGPGRMGENVTTRGLDLLSLSAGTRLLLGSSAVLEVTGLRNPCTQLDDLAPGLMNAVLGRDQDGSLIRKAGIMCIVVAGGDVYPGDSINVEPPLLHTPLQPV